MQNQGEGRGCLGALLGIVLVVVTGFFLSPLVGVLTVIGVALASSLPWIDDGIIQGLSVAASVQYAVLFLNILAGIPVPDRLGGDSVATAFCCFVMFAVFAGSQKRD